MKYNDKDVKRLVTVAKAAVALFRLLSPEDAAPYIHTKLADSLKPFTEFQGMPRPKG